MGHTVQARSEGHYVSAGKVRWDRREEKGRTLLRIYGDHPLVVDRVHYTTGDTMPYLRQAELYTMRSEWRTERRQRKVLQRWREDLGTGTLASYQRTMIEGPRHRSGHAVPRSAERRRPTTGHHPSLDVLQRQRTLLAPLSAGLTYTLTTGDPQANAPQFDIAHFRDSLPTPIDTLTLASPRYGHMIVSARNLRPVHALALGRDPCGGWTFGLRGGRGVAEAASPPTAFPEHSYSNGT